MTDFLLELRSEEIPARMQLKAKDDLVRLFTEALTKAGLAAESIEAFATPRRLALIAKGLPLETEAVAEETKGPKVGAPPQAMEGFLRKVGLNQDQLVERDGVYFAIAEKPGRNTADVLAEAIPAIIRAFPWPKSQRWGAASVSTESLRWVRPLQGIIALLGDDVVACEIDGIVSGRTTMGHRFHSAGPVDIANADSYVETLRAAHVIVHFSERTAIIRDGAKAAAQAAGLVLVEDEGLVAENAGLTEWPVPMLGRFDPGYLQVPQEVIQLTARVNQKYFVCQKPLPSKGGVGAGEPDGSLALVPTPNPSHGREGDIANAFVCTANIVANDGGAAIVAGNEKVLAARLSDAKFFWEQDLRVPLDDQAKKLAQITFHEKLGTVADKVERVAKLARWLVEEGIVPSKTVSAEPVEARPADTRPSTSSGLTVEERAELANQAERAARLCKADLVTGMVGEFPELQGIMGGYYARAQGEPDAVADAVRDHYKPVGQGDDVPTAPVTVAVSLADKLDTFSSFFAVGEFPTGTRDPYALRRSTIGILQLLQSNGLKMPMGPTLSFSLSLIYDGFLNNQGRRLYPIQIDFQKSEFVEIARSGNVKGHTDPFKPIYFFETSPNQDFFQVAERSEQALSYSEFLMIPELEFAEKSREFIKDRLKIQQKQEGTRHDLIDAVFSVTSNDDVLVLVNLVKALQTFVATQEGADLLAGYKRAANILKGDTSSKNDRHPELVSGSISPNKPERETDKWMLKQVQHDDVSEVEVELLNALNTAEPLAATAIEAEKFENAMAALASLRAPIDAFFDGVMVNDPDPEKRAFRLGLLTRFRDAVHRVADFSRIEG